MKETRTGKAIAPVVDIFPQIAVGFHDQARVAKEMALLKSFGFDRVYFVLCNPGYPTFSNPILCIQPPDVEGFENYSFQSIVALGDPNFAYVHECHRLGMEAFAVIKPYEGGGGSTVPHGAKTAFNSPSVKTIGGERLGFDALLSKHPHLAVQRKPIPDYEELISQPVTAISLSFCLDALPGRVDAVPSEAAAEGARFHLFSSRDNGQFHKYSGPAQISKFIEEIIIRDANGAPLFAQPSRCWKVDISQLEFSAEDTYFAVVIESTEKFHTIPQSMIALRGAKGEIPCTATSYIRRSGNTVQEKKAPAERIWGMEQIPRSFDEPEDAIRAFSQWGFEFEWYGSGFWGPGWQSSAAYGIARGKLLTMKGTPCEAYPEVRRYWVDWVQKCIEMGFDGVDIRLQNHSGMVSDYASFGYNAPLVEAYRDQHGVDILVEEADPLELMAIRGEFFAQFVREAAASLHNAGRKLQIHLRNCHEQARLSADFNELGFWAMPKVWLENWRELVDLADEVTLKDYHFNNYQPSIAHEIKQYATSRGKRVWVHCYISQGRELNESFIEQVEADPDVSGILIYEVAHSETNEINFGLIEQYKEVGLNEPVAQELRAIISKFEYR